MKELKLLKLWLFIGLSYIAVIFYLCLKRTEPSIPPFQHIDKVIHFSAYFLMMSYFVQITKKESYKNIFIIFFLIGVLIELLQLMSGYRSFELLDILANTTGLVIGLVTFGKFFSNIILYIEKLLNFKDT
ncbi:VanZ family protein [Halobacteriovorax sp.]|uniref:VanZ family protein n=1 Tax=Halobacteriovorax sp. TaxID=2020862 RepID=UPI003566CF0F